MPEDTNAAAVEATPAPEAPAAPVDENTKMVTLVGTDAEKTGNHTLFALDSSVVFVDGTANVPLDIAKKLKKAGYVE